MTAPASRASRRPTMWAGWMLLTVLATIVALFSMRYVLPTVPYARLPNFFVRRPALTTHALAASVALLTGPWQFLPGLRARHLGPHRVLGRIYGVAVLLGWLASIPVGLHALTGAAASAGFLTLGGAWIAATAVAVGQVLRGDIAAHRRWMARSYALTAAAITLRIYLAIALILKLPVAIAYPAIAWLCWVPNSLFAEWWVRRPASAGRAAALRHPASSLTARQSV